MDYSLPWQTLPLELPIMPLNSVLFPGMPMPLFIFEQRYRDMIESCLEESRTFGVALIRQGVEVGGPAVPWEIGTTATIVRALELEEGGLHVMTVGTRRFRLVSLLQEEPYLMGKVEILDDEDDAMAPLELHDELREIFDDYLQLVLQLLGQPDTELNLPDSPSRLSYMVAAHLGCPLQARQKLLEMDNLAERLFREKQLLQTEAKEYRLLLAARQKQERLHGSVTENVFSLN